MSKIKHNGFTLIEVLLALVIISIAFTALIKATTQTVNTTKRIKDTSIAHWVAMQGVTMIQLGLLPIELNQTVSESTTILNSKWYWQATINATPIPHMQSIQISISQNIAGPFNNILLAWRYLP